MILSLSSAAAPDLELREIAAVCSHRGLGGLELVPGTAHGVGPHWSPSRVRSALDAAAAEGGAAVRIVALEVERPAEAAQLAPLAGALHLALLLPADRWEPGELVARARAAADDGAHVVLFRSFSSAAVSDTASLLAEIGHARVHAGWEVDPASAPLDFAERLLDPAAPPPAYLRLRGGGPEAAAQTGMGVGELIGRLTLARFAGPLVLTPSSPTFHVAWSAWLGRRGGWGCGSKADRELVGLSPALSPASVQ
jgi:hypothetical protein